MIQLRLATSDDLRTLLFWDEQQHVIDSDPDDEWNWEIELERFPFWREQLMAVINDEPIGFIQIIDPFHEETKYWGNVSENKRAIDIWIGEEKNLSKGYGTQMMKLAIERCFAQTHVTSILIDPLKSNLKAHKFYEKFGFKFVEERRFDEQDCFVYELERINYKY